MKKLVDFNELFSAYFAEWYESNSDKYTVEEVEDIVPELYEKWNETYNAFIDCKPYEYYSNFEVCELLDIVEDFSNQKMPICEVLIAELGMRKITKEIFERLSQDINEEVQMIYLNLLSENCTSLHEDYMAELLLDKTAGENARDLAAELLVDCADNVAKKLIKRSDKSDEKTHMLVCEVICRTKNCKEACDYIMSMFSKGYSVELLSDFIKKLGDERALPRLQELIDLEETNYIEFIELRSAIEALGGTVTSERDFSNDPYFQKLKNQK